MTRRMLLGLVPAALIGADASYPTREPNYEPPVEPIQQPQAASIPTIDISSAVVSVRYMGYPSGPHDPEQPLPPLLLFTVRQSLTSSLMLSSVGRMIRVKWQMGLATGTIANAQMKIGQYGGINYEFLFSFTELNGIRS